MGKRKMEMKLIENEKARKKIFEQRKKNLLKKAKELLILCDIKILLIIYELNKQKPEIWPDNIKDEEAEQIINRFKQQPARGNSKKACDSFASKNKKGLCEKFAISDHKSMINRFSENELQKLCFELDAKIDAVINAIKSKQALKEEPRSSKMLGDSLYYSVSGVSIGYGYVSDTSVRHESFKKNEESELFSLGFLNKGKGKEVVIYQEPAHIQQDQSFQMLSNRPNFMESPMMMLQNDIRYPEFDGNSSSSNLITYAPLPIDYDDPSWMQPAYMNANSSMSYYDPTIDHISPGIYYSMMPGFPSQMNASD